jgi:hypothetical protein
MPVAISQIDRQCGRMACQLATESGHQGAILLVDRTHAAEVLIVLRHCQQALPRHRSASSHILEKGQYIVGAFRSSE